MCGIYAILDLVESGGDARKLALEQAKKLRHRGPDWSGVYSNEKGVLAHERLAIVDVQSGSQPLVDLKTGRVLAVNGEIYNHKELRHQLKKPHDFQTESDCEVILYLYDEYGPSCVSYLNGIFAFVLFDPKDGSYLVARDDVGVIPLYSGRDHWGQYHIASELKALVGVCQHIDDFPPGHFFTSTQNQFQSYREWPWENHIPHNVCHAQDLKEELRGAVRRQMMCDVPFGVLLSGGLDSSVIAALAVAMSERRVETNGEERAWWPRLHSFSVGLEDAPDLPLAQKVADAIGTQHHTFHFTIQEGLDALSEVIYHIESFDVTTVRASTPMYLMARKIKAMGIKMVLSGEGSDEIFGGYLYFHKAPNPSEFHKELVRKIQSLHKYDCLRANKAMAAWGVEARVPFLDKEFLKYAMAMNPTYKMCGDGRLEKHILRKAFEKELPHEVLWRQKEQFSDGVGYKWIDSLKGYAEKEVTDQELALAKHRFPLKTPTTKEEYLYRKLFETHFPHPGALEPVAWGPSVACSSATALLWDPAFLANTDPSGRSVGLHRAATGPC